MGNYGFYGNVSYSTEYLNRYRPYNRSTNMNGLGSTIASGRYRGALGRTYQGPAMTSRVSDFAVMRQLGMTPAGPRMDGVYGLGSAASDRALCQALGAVSVGVANAIASGVRPVSLDPATATATQIATRTREQADYDRISGSVIGAGAAFVNFCNMINAEGGTSVPGSTGPSAWEIEAARRAYEDSARDATAGKKTMQTALLVGGGVLAAAAVWFLVK